MIPLILTSSIVSALITYFSTPIIARYMKARGHIGIDVHKPEKNEIPTSCGLSIILGLTIGCLIVYMGGSNVLKIKVLTFLLPVIINAIIGFIDDLKVLSGRVKMLATVISIIPIIYFSLRFPKIIILGRPEIPILGRLRLTIIYWLLLPLAIAGPANAVNMLEVLNGVMPITCSIATLCLLVSAIMLQRLEGILLSAILLATLVAYLPYNKYPAKVFSGDVGSLSVGAAIGAIAVISRLEIIAMAALSPHIMNAFYVVAFVKGFKEHRKIPRPTRVLRDGTIIDSKDPKAPITLVRMIAGSEGAKEVDIVVSLTIMELISALVGIFLAFLMMISG